MGICIYGYKNGDGYEWAERNTDRDRCMDKINSMNRTNRKDRIEKIEELNR